MQQDQRHAAALVDVVHPHAIDIKLQGKTVAKALELAKQTGDSTATIIRQFDAVEVATGLQVAITDDRVVVSRDPRGADLLMVFHDTDVLLEWDGLRAALASRKADVFHLIPSGMDPEEFDPWYVFQPVVEIERDPLLAPGEFEMVADPRMAAR